VFVFKDLAFGFKTNLRFELARIYGIGYQRASKIADLIGLSNYFTMDNMNYFFLKFQVYCSSYIILQMIDYVF